MKNNELLDSYIDQITEMKRDVLGFCQNLPEADFNFKINQDKWSIAECLDHLIVTGEKYLERISDALDTGRKAGLFSNDAYKPRFVRRKLIQFLEPPYRIKVSTFSVFKPSSKMNKEKIIEAFLNLQDRLINHIHKTEGLNLKKIYITSPVSRFVKLEVGEALYLLIVHQRRHIWQAKQILPKLRHL